MFFSDWKSQECFLFTLRVHLQPRRLTLHLERIRQGLDRLAVGLHFNELYRSLGGQVVQYAKGVQDLSCYAGVTNDSDI